MQLIRIERYPSYVFVPSTISRFQDIQQFRMTPTLNFKFHKVFNIY